MSPTTLNAVASQHVSDPHANTIGYAGYVYDPAIDHYLARNRWMNAGSGRWLNRDPAGYADGMSLYEYVAGGPVSYTDPSGLVLTCRDLRDIGLSDDQIIEYLRAQADYYEEWMDYAMQEAEREAFVNSRVGRLIVSGKAIANAVAGTAAQVLSFGFVEYQPFSVDQYERNVGYQAAFNAVYYPLQAWAIVSGVRGLAQLPQALRAGGRAIAKLMRGGDPGGPGRGGGDPWRRAGRDLRRSGVRGRGWADGARRSRRRRRIQSRRGGECLGGATVFISSRTSTQRLCQRKD